MITDAPAQQAHQLIFGKFVTDMIGSLCQLHAFDYVADGGTTASEIAEKCGADSQSMYRVLRALTMVDVCVEDKDNRFTLTSVGKLFRWDTTGSSAALAAWIAHKGRATAHGFMIDSIQTGDCAFVKAHDAPVWSQMEKDSHFHTTFQTAMTALSKAETPALVSGYDFSPFEVICDVGGGHGFLLGSIIAASPKSRGILFDLPEVIHEATPILTSLGVKDRVQCIGGDMFHAMPHDVDLFVLKHIIHDWSDEACIKILTRCARGLKKGGKVLVAEHVMTPPMVPDEAKLLDIEMLLMTEGGKERTAEQFAALFDAAGLTFTRTINLTTPIQWIEAVQK